MEGCKHFNFETDTSVSRLHEDGTPEDITGYRLDLIVRCVDCGLPFEFVGLPGGYHINNPTVNFDATELRCPIKPSSDPVAHANVLLNSQK